MKCLRNSVYLSNVGFQPMAIVNALWIYGNLYGCPSLIHLFVTDKTLKFIELIEDSIKVFCPNIEVIYDLVKETELEEIIDIYSSRIKDYKEKGIRTITDVTAGRKTMSIALYTASLRSGSDEILYLYLKDEEYKGVFYAKIPKPLVSLVRLGGEKV